jgi:soluble lytic murein transglycosylase-like protein
MRTAAATEQEASGCSFFVLPPLAVIVVSVMLAVLALNHPTNIQPVESRAPILDTQAAQMPGQSAPAVTEQPSIEIPAASPLLPPRISPIFTASIQYWGGSIATWAAAANVDPNLAATVMQIESCGDPRAVSRSGAIGLFQVMPFHFSATDSPFEPDTNAARGLNYLSRSLTKAGGDARLALAGYNGGIGVIGRGEWTWASETKRYVQYGWPIYQDARDGTSSSAALDEWYRKYGASLCRQASKRLGLP